MKLPLLVAAAAVVLGLPPTAVQAADVKVGGIVAYVTTSQEQTALADGSTLVRIHEKGVIVDSGTPGPLDHNAQNCDGIVVISKDGQHAPGAGSCDAIDKDGDRWSMWWQTTDDKNQWGVTWGTGKFAGMTGGGGTDELFSFDDREVINYQGTLHLK